MHLHGQFFRVIARNGLKVEELFWRDTVLIGPKESIDIALVPMDKGVWEEITPARERYDALIQEPAHIEQQLQEGAEKARAISAPFLLELRKAVGLVLILLISFLSFFSGTNRGIVLL
jgi:hypothetical protein